MDGEPASPAKTERRRRRQLPTAPSTPSRAGSGSARSSISRHTPSTESAGSAASPPRRQESAASMSLAMPGTPTRPSPAASGHDLEGEDDHAAGAADSVAHSSSDRDVDGGMESQNIIVAVRVRPPNDRENAYGGECTLHMHGCLTTITGPEKEHTFKYDHSFWSHNEKDPHFADQAHVFQHMGVPLLQRAFEGYNCCLFAYGQTGSGKSYTMMGERDQRGIIPRFAQRMWEEIAVKPDIEFKVEISYFEIYAEQIFDLLVPASKNDKAKLKVREHPVMGPYVENLKVYPALCYDDIEGYMTLGSKYRATASTNMNATSSRSHAVFIVNLTQTEMDHEIGEEHTKVSRVNLIDLAGSERSDAAGTTGQRLREGSAINKSLHTLGKIISILADKGVGKRKKVFVPYRDSVLTWILKDSLGGNSKTGMLATLSPSLENYAETLSTLRYAHQARSIVNEAKVNEDPNIALIRQLRAEIEAYRAQYGEARGTHVAMAVVEGLREKLSASEQLMANINRSWEEKLRQSERIREENQRMLEERGVDRDLRKIENRLPNLVNLNEDPQLSEMLIYIIKEGLTTVGKDPDNDIELRGVFVRGKHAAIHCSEDHTVMLTTIEDALLYINGEAQANNSTVQLKHGDRVVVGNHHFFRLNIPGSVKKAPEEDKAAQIKDYAFAREELEHVQAAKIEAQLEAEHARKTAAILEQLNQEKAAAQARLAEQQRQFEEKLKTIELQAHANAGVQQSQVERAEKLALQYKMAQAEEEQLRIELETEKELLAGKMAADQAAARRQMEEEAAAKNKIIQELELEKKKIEEDLQSLKEQHESRRKRSSIAGAGASGIDLLRGARGAAGAGPGGGAAAGGSSKKHDWLHISGLIAEANEISNRLKQNTVFRRLDNYLDNDEPRVKLHNTKLGISTTWSLPKFEERLEQIGIVYRQIVDDGLDPSAADELFYNPDDEWERDAVPAAVGWATKNRRAKSMFDFGDALMPDLAEFRAEQRVSAAAASAAAADHGEGEAGAGPRRPSAAPEEADASVPLLCRQYIKNSLGSLQNQHTKPRTAADDIVESASAMQTAVNSLNAAFAAHKGGDPGALCSRGDVRNASISVTMSMELLCITSRAIGRQGATGGLTLEKIAESLSSAVVNTGSALAKLLQGIENGIASMVSESCADVTESIRALCEAAGELAIATAPQDGEDDEAVSEDEPSDEEDPEEFAAEEEEATFASSSRMVRLGSSLGDAGGGGSRRGNTAVGPAGELFKIDDAILAAFERGTRMHVHNSMARLTSDMEDRAAATDDLVHHLGPKSNVNAMIVHAAANVIKSTRHTFETAQQLQDILGKTESATQAKRTFYRKSFTRAKGIINEVRDMADTINNLSASCAKAVSGTDDVSSLMSNAKNLRGAVARLIHASEFKLGRRTTAAHQLNSALRNACADVTRASKQLTSDCEEWNQSDEARAKRSEAGAAARSSRGGSATPLRYGGTPARARTSSASSTGGKPGKLPTSDVQRRTMLVEQQSEVYRLEAELADAQKLVKELQRSMYKVMEDSGEGTTTI